MLIEKAADVLSGKSKQLKLEMDIENTDRTFGATLSHEISRYAVYQGVASFDKH